MSCCRPKLKNIDRSSAQQLAITVGNVTVIITDFKEKTRSSSTSSSTATSSSGSSEQQHLSSSSESTDRGSSRASTPRRDLTSGHNELLWGCWKSRIFKRIVDAQIEPLHLKGWRIIIMHGHRFHLDILWQGVPCVSILFLTHPPQVPPHTLVSYHLRLMSGHWEHQRKRM